MHLTTWKKKKLPLPGSKACEEVGRVWRDLLTVDFMSRLRTRGDEPIQAGSSQLLFPVGSSLVGLVGALMARSYICTTKSHERTGHVGVEADVRAFYARHHTAVKGRAEKNEPLEIARHLLF